MLVMSMEVGYVVTMSYAKLALEGLVLVHTT